MKKEVKKGFTLVELIAVIAIISLILGISYTIFSKIINNSKEKSDTLAKTNILKTVTTYIEENEPNIIWTKDTINSEEEFNCVAVNELINKGYFDEKTIQNNNQIKKEDYIIVTRNASTKSIIKEEIDENSKCSAGFEIIDVPKCNNLTFNNKDQQLIDQPELYNCEETCNRKNAGTYPITLTLNNENNTSNQQKIFPNGTNTVKINCSIKKANTEISLDPPYNLTPENKTINTNVTVNGIIDNIINDSLSIKGELKAISSNKEYVKIDEIDNDNRTIKMTAITARTKTTAIKITFTPDSEDDLSKNFKSSSKSFYVSSKDNYKICNTKINSKDENNNSKSSTISTLKETPYKNYLKTPTYTIPGYTFGGWKLSNGTIINDNTIIKDCEIEVNEIWNANQAIININKDNSSWINSGINIALYSGTTKTYDYNISTKNNNSIIWSGVKNGEYKIYASISQNNKTTLVDTGITITISNNSPTKEIDYYTLTLNNNTGISAVTGDGIYLKNQSPTIQATPTSKYSFEKWTVNLGNNPNSLTSATTNVKINTKTILTATSTPYQLTINYYPNNGSKISDTSNAVAVTWNSSYWTRTISYSTNVNSFNLNNVTNLFTRTGYNIDSNKAWRINSTSGTEISETTTDLSSYFKEKTNTLNLYANWKANTYTIKFDGNGNDSGSTASKTCTYDSNCTLTANGFNKTGYNFLGWATSKTGTVVYKNQASVKNLASTNGASVTLYAKWTANKYTIKFDGNGYDSGSTASKTCTYDSDCTLTANGFKKTDYYFNGWATTDSGNSKYENKATVKNLTSVNNGTITLYAKWTTLRLYEMTDDWKVWVKAGYNFGCYDDETCAEDQNYLQYRTSSTRYQYHYSSSSDTKNEYISHIQKNLYGYVKKGTQVYSKLTTTTLGPSNNTKDWITIYIKAGDLNTYTNTKYHVNSYPSITNSTKFVHANTTYYRAYVRANCNTNLNNCNNGGISLIT